MALSDFDDDMRDAAFRAAPERERRAHAAVLGARLDMSTIWTVAVLCLLLGFSAALLAVTVPPETEETRLAGEALYHETDRAQPLAIAPDDARPVTLPYGNCCEARFAVFTIPLTAEDRAHADPALFVERIRNNAAYYLDGDWVAGSGRIYPDTDNLSRQPQFFRLPPDRMASAETLQIVVARPTGRKLLYPVWLGEYGALRPVHARHKLFAHHLPIVFGVVGIFTALLCAAAAPLYPRRRLLYSVAALFFGWASLMLVQQIVASPIPHRVINGTYYALFWITLGAATSFVLDWTARPGSSARREWIAAVWIVAGVAAVVSFYLAYAYAGPGATRANRAVTWTALFLIPALGVRLFLFYRNQPRTALVEMLAFGIIIAAVVADMVMIRFLDREGMFQPAASLFFPFALLLSLARRGRGVFDLALATNDRLQSEVAIAEARVLESQRQLRESEKRDTLNRERARFMRDIHDGFGGDLVSLLSAMDRGRGGLPEPDIRAQVQHALDDLRLMIDSLDGMGSSLDVALALFQERAQARLLASGIGFVFDNELQDPSEGYPPGVILNIYRILQEGVTNIVKHSGATSVRLSVRRETTDDESVIIGLQDDGTGLGLKMDMAMKAGRGLPSMQRRAEAIGARLTVKGSPDGTSLTLRLSEAMRSTAF